MSRWMFVMTLFSYGISNPCFQPLKCGRKISPGHCMTSHRTTLCWLAASVANWVAISSSSHDTMITEYVTNTFKKRFCYSAYICKIYWNWTIDCWVIAKKLFLKWRPCAILNFLNFRIWSWVLLSSTSAFVYQISSKSVYLRWDFMILKMADIDNMPTNDNRQ